MKIYRAALFLLLTNYICRAFADDVVVQTPQGRFHGYTTDISQRFLGIRYGQAPVGSVRWQSPVPYQYPGGATGDNDATKFGNSCMQLERASLGPLSEDCLFLNIYSPLGTNNGSNHPVLVWIHGGGFLSGSGNLYPADQLAQIANVVIVTLNYRLGVFGFLVTSALLAESPVVNFGLQDQQLALLWVQKYIASFGGNPSKVLLFGESAGGSSVVYHMMMRNSWSYYAAAGIESPGALFYSFTSSEVSQTLGVRAERNLNCSQASNPLNCMRQVDAKTVLYRTLTLLPLFPVVDGQQILKSPSEAFANGEYNTNVPFIIGHNLAEGNMFAFSDSIKLHLHPFDSMSKSQFESVVSGHFHFNETLGQLAVSWYEPLSSQLGYWHAASKFEGDFLINCNTHTIANSAVKFSNKGVFRYLFTHTSVKSAISFLNATHCMEIAYVFHEDVIYNTTFSKNEDTLSRLIIKYYVNLIRFGDPNGRCLGSFCNPDNTVTWPAYDGDPSSSILVLDIVSLPGTDPSLWSMCSSWMSQICPSC